MTDADLLLILQGDGAETVDASTQNTAKAIAKGRSVAQALSLTSSPDSRRSGVPIYLARMGGGEGVHVSGLLPQIYDAWMAQSFKLEVHAFEQAVEAATAIYADLLSRPWGVLCALTYDAVIWFRPGSSPDEELDAGRIRLFLNALRRESAWLRSLDGRFIGPLSEKPRHLWQVSTALGFLTARNGMPAPTSWKAWNSTVETLLSCPAKTDV